MSRNNLYSLFKKKLEEDTKEKRLADSELKDSFAKKAKCRVLITFSNVINREEFIKTYEHKQILNKFDIIPSVNLELTIEEINNLQNTDLILSIEEDQRIFPSIQDITHTLGLNKLKKYRKLYTGKNVIIGLIDDGIDQKIESLSNTVLSKYVLNQPSRSQKAQKATNISNHGTLMANIITNQYVNEEKTYIGIAPDAKLIDFDISNEIQEYYFSNILVIFDFILKKKIKLDIILLPYNTKNPSDGKDVLSKACNLMVDLNYIIICPAGNNGPNSNTIGSPAAAENVITIGALTKNNMIAAYSARGPTLSEVTKPDFYLPGSDAQVILSNEIKVQFSGTSVAAAVATGIVTLIKQVDSALSHIKILNILKRNSILLKDSEKIDQAYGILNVKDILVELNNYPQKKIIYNYIYLIKRALTFSAEFFIVMIIIYVIFNFL